MRCKQPSQPLRGAHLPPTEPSGTAFCDPGRSSWGGLAGEAGLAQGEVQAERGLEWGQICRRGRWHKAPAFCKDSMTSKPLGARQVLFCGSQTLPTEPRGPVASAGLPRLHVVWGLLPPGLGELPGSRGEERNWVLPARGPLVSQAKSLRCASAMCPHGPLFVQRPVTAFLIWCDWCRMTIIFLALVSLLPQQLTKLHQLAMQQTPFPPLGQTNPAFPGTYPAALSDLLSSHLGTLFLNGRFSGRRAEQVQL